MGGKWIIRLKKGLASRCWENVVLAMLGEQFMVGEEICGAVISVRYQVRAPVMPRLGTCAIHSPTRYMPVSWPNASQIVGDWGWLL